MLSLHSTHDFIFSGCHTANKIIMNSINFANLTRSYVHAQWWIVRRMNFEMHSEISVQGSCGAIKTNYLGVVLYKINEQLFTCVPIHVSWFGIIPWRFFYKFICQFHNFLPWDTVVHITGSGYIINKFTFFFREHRLYRTFISICKLFIPIYYVVLQMSLKSRMFRNSCNEQSFVFKS